MVNRPAVSNKENEPSLSERLVRLPGGQWAAWRWVGLRGAGFPAEQVLNLAIPECAVSADLLLGARNELMCIQDTARDALHQALKEITAGTEKHKAVKKSLRRVNKGKLPKALEFSCAATDAVDTFRHAWVEADTAQSNFQQAFAAAIDHTSQAIYQVACTDRFCEAITWQNRRALLTGVHPIIRKPPGTTSRNSKRRQHEELVANYLQRYCVKNDTIGFFGPVGWAKFTPQEESLVTRPGPDFLASRNVYFEGWCVDALTVTLGRNKELRPWLTPRRMPSIDLDGTTLYRPFQNPSQISVEQATVLQACDGKQTAKEIALQMIHTPSLGLDSEAKVYNFLEQLESAGLIEWKLRVPLETYPERTLRRLFERIEDERLRKLNLRAIDVLEKAKSGVARSAGNAKNLDKALSVMNTIFTRLTGASPTRAAGKTYAARTLVYEDCRRNIEVDIGQDILQSLGPPLSLLLDSARWFTVEAAGTVYRNVVQKVYTKVSTRTGSPVVPLVDIWPKFQSMLYTKDPHPLASVLSAFQDRWSRILTFPTEARRVEFTSDELRPHVLAAFESSQPNYPFTRYHTPDVLIAASSPQAIRRGDYELVMGELHMGANTLTSAFFLAQHPARDELFQALGANRPPPRVVPIPPKEWPELTARIHPALVLPQDFRLASTPDAYGNPEWRTLPIGTLVIEELDGELVVRTRDGQLCFDAIEFVADLITERVVNFFKILRPAPHTPRISIDRLIISRETWRIPAGELDFAYEKSEANRFLAFRRWAQDHGIPRFAFVKTSIERKPFYVDFDSPIFVNILAKHIRRAKEQGSKDALFSISEMLPNPSQIWLPDVDGRCYTNEFRIVSVSLGDKATERGLILLD